MLSCSSSALSIWSAFPGCWAPRRKAKTKMESCFFQGFSSEYAHENETKWTKQGLFDNRGFGRWLGCHFDGIARHCSGKLEGQPGDSWRGLEWDYGWSKSRIRQVPIHNTSHPPKPRSSLTTEYPCRWCGLLKSRQTTGSAVLVAGLQKIPLRETQPYGETPRGLGRSGLPTLNDGLETSPARNHRHGFAPPAARKDVPATPRVSLESWLVRVWGHMRPPG